MLTDADLAPMLRAVPSYAPEWAAERAGLAAERVAFEFFNGLAWHLADRAAAGDLSEFAPMFAALDRLYRDGAGAGDMDTVLTTGFLESLIFAAEDRGVDVGLIARHLTGADARAGWDAAYAYMHPNGTPP